MELQRKVCLVTGGTSGIGAATARHLVAKGAQVVSVSRGGLEGMQSCRPEFNESDASIRFVKGDVANPTACRNLVERVISEFGRLDVLVHSAGGAVPGGLFEVSDENWMSAFAVHVHSIFHLSRAAAPQMMKQGDGVIILLGSAAGLRGCLGALAYGVAKGALPQFARGLARELADQNIRVNCVSPGIIRTPFQAHLTPEQVDNNIRNRVPLHREGRPDEVAHVILSLIENDFITGENVIVDGGMTMRIV